MPLFNETLINIANFGVLSENSSEMEAESPRRHYPKWSVCCRDYTEGHVSHNDDYMWKYTLPLLQQLLLLLLLLSQLLGMSLILWKTECF